MPTDLIVDQTKQHILSESESEGMTPLDFILKGFKDNINKTKGNKTSEK